MRVRPLPITPRLCLPPLIVTPSQVSPNTFISSPAPSAMLAHFDLATPGDPVAVPLPPSRLVTPAPSTPLYTSAAAVPLSQPPFPFPLTQAGPVSTPELTPPPAGPNDAVLDGIIRAADVTRPLGELTNAVHLLRMRFSPSGVSLPLLLSLPRPCRLWTSSFPHPPLPPRSPCLWAYRLDPLAVVGWLRRCTTPQMAWIWTLRCLLRLLRVLLLLPRTPCHLPLRIR